jgi:hypothetical protein
MKTQQRRETIRLPAGAIVAARDGNALAYSNRTQAERCLEFYKSEGVNAWIWNPGRVFYVRIA